MKYYLIEGKFKTFSFSLYDDENKDLKAEFDAFIQAGMDRGDFLMFGDKAHGLLAFARGGHLDDVLSEFESDPLTLADVVEYRIVEIEDAVISKHPEKFLEK